MTNVRNEKKKTEKAFLQSLLFMVIAMLIIFVMSGFVSVYQAVDNKLFADGVYIDGVDLSGKSYDEAQQLLEENANKALNDMQMTLAYEGEETIFDSHDLGISINYKDTLDNIYQYNRDDADSLEQRFDKTAELSKDKHNVSPVEIDDSKINTTIEDYAARYKKDAVEADAIFDSGTRTFTFTEEENGTYIDAGLLVSQIKSKVMDNDFSPLEVNSEVIYPHVKLSDLQNNMGRVAAYETIADDNENRNVNIQLMCDAVDGLEIKPGQVLSINELVGQRTEAKGFKAAPAIVDGLAQDDIGGGICQLAGTLYNAALLADMEIVERVNHTWPSNYLPIGQDSTLNWDDKDLKIKNTTEYSLFISARLENQKVKVSIYGKLLEPGVTIKVQNEIVEELQPPKTEYRYTSEMPVGFSETIRKGRTGYNVKVYRIYYKNGIETDRVLISWDRYPPLGKIVLVGKYIQDK